MGISAVIISFNEEAKIGNCIRSVSWADEVLVIDSHSIDRTREIASDLGASVIERDWPGFALQKQFATDSARHDIIFSIDADEVVTPELAQEIRSLDLESADAFRMPRLSYYLSKPIRHGSWYPDKQIRLFDRRRCHWSNDAIHESVLVPSGNVQDLRSDLQHYSSDGIRHHAQMMVERYAPLGAEKLRLEGKQVGLIRLMFTGPAAFISGYFLKLGFLDGIPGFIIAMFAGFNNFLKYALRYESIMKDRSSGSTGDTTDNDRQSS